MILNDATNTEDLQIWIVRKKITSETFFNYFNNAQRGCFFGSLGIATSGRVFACYVIGKQLFSLRRS